MTSQLLAAALKHEKPELELRKSELLKVEEEHKLEIGRLEDFLLEELANATGNLLENKELLASLNETKAKSASIQVIAHSHMSPKIQRGGWELRTCYGLERGQAFSMLTSYFWKSWEAQKIMLSGREEYTYPYHFNPS